LCYFSLVFRIFALLILFHNFFPWLPVGTVLSFWFLGLTYGIYMNVSGSHGIPEAIAIAVVVLLHLWKCQMLLSIAGGTICYMLLVQLVF